MKFSKYNIIHTTENQEHILFNSLWGSTFVISPSVKQAIESSNPTLLTEEENRLFIKYNALIPDEYNESCIYNHFYNKSRYGKKCLTATVLLTWSCNFRCISSCRFQYGDQFLKIMARMRYVKCPQNEYDFRHTHGVGCC